MKCPICGQQLRPGKKDPNYLLCYNCKKKYKVPAAKKTEKKPEEEHSGYYSNIPPKEVREKREKEMRKAYDEMLSVEDGKKRKKKSQPKPKPKREESYDDGYDELYDDYEDDKPSKAPIIILGIAIIVVAAVIGYMVFF